jgi:CHAT domain-containing protein/tetratricopeptide (TPR) repeat protein
MTPRVCLLLSLFASTALGQAPAGSVGLEPGVVIEAVTNGGEAAKGGLEPGDVVLRWSRGDAEGDVESPSDIPLVEIEQAPRGAVTLQGLRGSEARSWTLGPGGWGIQARPNLRGSLLSSYLEGQTRSAAGRPEEAIAALQAAVAEARGSDSRWLGPWLLSRVAEEWIKARRGKEADEAYGEAIRQAEGGPWPVKVQLLHDRAALFRRRDDAASAEQAYRQAIQESLRSGAENLMTASNLNNLGILLFDTDRLAEAAEAYGHALKIRQELAPGSRGVAGSFNNLGNVAASRGDPAEAEQYYLQALATYSHLLPDSSYVAICLAALASVAMDRGELAMAEQYSRQALAIQQRTSPESVDIAITFNNLGLALLARDDLDQAEESFRRSLAIKEKVVRGSILMSASLENLGIVASRRGDLTGAEEYFRKSLEIKQARVPDGRGSALSLDDLGELALRRGDLQAAEGLFRKALAIQDKIAAGGIEIAGTWDDLGELDALQGKLEEAEGDRRHALTIREKLAPHSAACAATLAGLAGIMRRQGRLEAAAQTYREALSALESQDARLGGSDERRSSFRAEHTHYYKEYLDLLVSMKRPREAFAVLERSHARGLLEALAAAHLDIRRGADPALLAEEKSLQERLRARYDRRLRLLGETHGDEQVRAVEAEIKDLETRYQEVQQKIRSGSPAYAALTQPQPFGADEVQEQLLDDDSVLLEYSLGDERSHLFVVTRTSLDSYELPRRSDIEGQARHLHDLLRERDHSVRGESVPARRARIAEADGAWEGVASAFSRTVLGPAAAQLGRKRVLIVADGALHYVPFAALPVPESRNPLMVDHTIASLPSASALIVARREVRRGEGLQQVVVLADPVFDGRDARVLRAPAVSQAEVPRQLTRSLADVGASERGPMHLPRLPFSREEAAAIVAAAPPGTGRRALDFEASRAFATGGELGRYRIVHFATHALVDDEHPELSGLVLSLVDKRGRPQDGFLELEDVYNLDLRADLVVLSGCETALGKQLEGEGVVGLTRGFMYAGAGSVVSSLWRVEDFATARLMTSFYGFIEKDGMHPAAALRAAQLEMRSQKRWAAPYYWAGFLLQGEWK